MIDRPIEIGRCCGMETNVDKIKVMRISRELSAVQIMLDQKQLENMECLNCLDSVITNYARRRCAIRSRIAMAKSALNRKKTLTAAWA
jgi:hypothetical protein